MVNDIQVNRHSDPCSFVTTNRLIGVNPSLGFLPFHPDTPETVTTHANERTFSRDNGKANMATIPARTGNLASPLSSPQLTQTAETTAAIPWYIWCATFAVTSATIGGYWDISWHSSIGRDTFWTPAHMAIQLCGVLAGIAFGYLILHTTFAKNSPLAPASVHIFGFRAPLGAFIASWGGIAMLTSAPFDNWWHDAYGIDVKIVSPPHILLIMGVYAVVIGTLVLLAGHMNRSQSQTHTSERRLLLFINGIMLVLMMILLMEATNRPFLHSPRALIAVALLPPIVLALSSRLTRFPFAATMVAAFYTLFRIGLILVLPLFPAEPKLGPVYQKVTHFIPPDFPLLFIVPAFLLDLFWQRTKSWSAWKSALVSSLIWLSAYLAVEWPFASFLNKPASDNWFFGTGYLFYALPPGSYMARHEFSPSGTPLQFTLALLVAFLIATLTFRWGMSRGEWLRKVKR